MFRYLLPIFFLFVHLEESQAQSLFWQGAGIHPKQKVGLGVFGVMPTNFSNIGFTGNFTAGMGDYYQMEGRIGVNTASTQSSYFGLLGKVLLSVTESKINFSALTGFEHNGMLAFVLSPVASYYFDFGEFYLGLYSRILFDLGGIGLAVHPGLNFEMGRNFMRWYVELQLGLTNSPSSIGSGVRWFF
ncbi:MAG: hypothetical protein KA715_05675 [Xanthomonadaceae bacterium]|nr:hypothetical protein [Xanthomonadaceae bacterium]